MTTFHNGILVKTVHAGAQQADWDEDLDPTVNHTYTQGTPSGTETVVGHHIMAGTDRKGRVHSRRYTTLLHMQHDDSVIQSVWVVINEYGHKVSITFPEIAPFGAGAAPAPISNVTEVLPASICPAISAYTTMTVVTGAGLVAFGTCIVGNTGDVSIWAGPVGTKFFAGILSTPGSLPFTVTYDTLKIDV
jgi:hypothetical protein